MQRDVVLDFVLCESLMDASTAGTDTSFLSREVSLFPLWVCPLSLSAILYLSMFLQTMTPSKGGFPFAVGLGATKAPDKLVSA